MLKKIPKTENLEIKDSFKEHYKDLLKDRYDEFMKYNFSFLRRSIRVNTLKISISNLKKRLENKWELTQIPWCNEGFWIEHKKKERRDIGNLPEHQLGYFHVQEAASMIPPVVLGPKKDEIILDMCSSPGSKSTQIGQYMENTGVLICNEPDKMRLKPLGVNLHKFGLTNTITTSMSGTQFKGFEFDRILVDAPCSGTGTIRKSLKTIKIWNPNMIKRLAILQKNLLETGFNNIKKGGTLVYSTCSVEPVENEAVISFLLDKYENAKLEDINLNIKRSSPILGFDGEEYNKEVSKCLRLWPQDNNTEGFFVSKIRKT
jgi:tRNA (cytosine49-C5)-methyltransferase